MPQLPTSTGEEYSGAEDEIKRYTQEEDEGSDISTVDVVNDIKDDLLNEDGRESIKGDEPLFRASSNQYNKDNQGLYGRPAPVIVGPQHSYYDQANGYRSSSNSTHPQHGSSYPSSTQIRMPMYPRGDDRYSYEHGPWSSQVPVHPYGIGYGPGGVPKNYNYRYPHHPGVAYYAPGHGYPGMPGRPVKEPKRPHVKKPLNAFMLFMKEQRPKIAAEFTLKESAAINQILGKRWHALDKSEQAKYYEMARKERAIHMQLYPGWSARDNYAQLGRKKKRPRDKNEEMNPKKCRARYGLDRQEQWCKPCRRKKKCIRFIVGADGETTEVPDKDQIELNSDSDNDTENRSNTNNLVDSKENIIQERVTMAAGSTTGGSGGVGLPKELSKAMDPHNNNNNTINSSTINILSATTLVNTTPTCNLPPTPTSYAVKQQQNESNVYTGGQTSFSGSSTNNIGYNASSQDSRTDTSTIDTSVLKTISAPCS